MIAAPQKSNAADRVPVALRALLSGLIDYAGMFPPAKLSLADAAGNFLRYARGPYAWMLGKLVVPVEQLEELRVVLAKNSEAQGLRVPLSVLLGAEPLRAGCVIQAERVRAAEKPQPFSIDAVEFRPGSPSMVAELFSILPPGLPVFCEIPYSEDLTGWLTAIRRAGWFAKIRTGGVTPESFPSSTAVAGFLAQCHAHGVAFKATAGLHHPVRSEHSLTYDPGSVCGVMHGFLNVFVGAALLECGVAKERLIEILDDTEPTSFRFQGDFAHWRKLFVSRTDLAGTRQHFAISFGSCSFDEPIQDLRRLALL